VDYVASAIVFGGEVSVTPGSTSHLALYTNVTDHTVTWRKYQVSTNYLGAAVPLIPVIIKSVLQICAPGVSPIALVPPLVNSYDRRFVGYGLSSSSGSLGIIIDSSNAFRQQDVTVPSGSTLFASYGMDFFTGLGAVNITNVTSLWDAKNNPLVNIAAFLTSPGSRCSVRSMSTEGWKDVVNSHCSTFDAFVKVNGRKVDSATMSIRANDSVEICPRIRGGMQAEGATESAVTPPAVTVITPPPAVSAAPTVVSPPADEAKVEVKGGTPQVEFMRAAYLKAIASADNDMLLGANSYTTSGAVAVWASLAKGDQVLNNNVGSFIGNRFHVQWLAGITTTIPAPEDDAAMRYIQPLRDRYMAEHMADWANRNPLKLKSVMSKLDVLTLQEQLDLAAASEPTGEYEPRDYSEHPITEFETYDYLSTVNEAATFDHAIARDEYIKSLKPESVMPYVRHGKKRAKVQKDQVRAIPGQITCLRGANISAVLPLQAVASMSDPWAKLQTALQTGDTVTMSQFIRINTSLANGDAMNRVLAVDGPKYTAGTFGSFSSQIAKLLLLAQGLVPLASIESSLSIFGQTESMRFSESSADITLAISGRQRYPAHPTAINLIEARIIDANTFTNIRAGTGAQIIPPADWDMSQWGKTVALVPVSFDMFNQPETIVPHTMSFLEAPYKVMGGFTDGRDHTGAVTAWQDALNSGGGHLTYMTGPVSKVLYVVVNAFARTDGTMFVQVGVGANIAVVNIDNNGITGVSVDITAALDSFFNTTTYSVDGMMTHITVAMTWWHKYFGNASDFYSALHAVTSASYWLSPLPVRNSISTDVYGVRNAATAPLVTDATILPMTITLLEHLCEASSHPDSLFTSTIAGLGAVAFWDNLRRMSTRQLGVLDPVAACDVVWGLLQFDACEYSYPKTALSCCARMRILAQEITALTDYSYQTTGFGLHELTNPRGLDAISQGGALIRMKHKELGDKFSRMFSPFTDRPLAVKFVPLNLANVAGWVFFSDLGLTFDQDLCYARLPATNLNSAGKAYDIPTDNIMHKIGCKFSVLRNNVTGAITEFTDFRVINPHGPEAMPWKDICSTQFIRNTVGTARVALNINLSNELKDAVRVIVIPVLPPLCSSAFARAWSYNNVVPTPIDYTIFNDVDAIVLPTLPNKSAAINQKLVLTINNNSFLYAQITRNNFFFYNKRIHLINDETFARVAVGDGGLGMLDEGSELLGFR
jgi:hypothetical protein